jgi:cytochrome P450
VAAGGGDFAPIAEVIPARAIGRLLGLPEGDVEKFRTWALMGGDMLAGDIDAERLSFLAAETARMLAYLGEHLERAPLGAREENEPSLLLLLADAVQRGEISRDEALGIAMVLFSAGGESTASLLGSAMKHLAGEPVLAERLRSEPELIPAFVEEICRLESPFKFHYRAVRRACELGGYTLEPGDRLMLLWASANRDPAVFADPDTLRLDRAHPRDHMSFGRGQHFCVGAPLARLEARVLLEEVLARTERLDLIPDDPARYTGSILVRRLERLPVACR